MITEEFVIGCFFFILSLYLFGFGLWLLKISFSRDRALHMRDICTEYHKQIVAFLIAFVKKV